MKNKTYIKVLLFMIVIMVSYLTLNFLGKCEQNNIKTEKIK